MRLLVVPMICLRAMPAAELRDKTSGGVYRQNCHGGSSQPVARLRESPKIISPSGRINSLGAVLSSRTSVDGNKQICLAGSAKPVRSTFDSIGIRISRSLVVRDSTWRVRMKEFVEIFVASPICSAVAFSRWINTIIGKKYGKLIRHVSV